MTDIKNLGDQTYLDASYPIFFKSGEGLTFSYDDRGDGSPVGVQDAGGGAREWLTVDEVKELHDQFGAIIADLPADDDDTKRITQRPTGQLANLLQDEDDYQAIFIPEDQDTIEKIIVDPKSENMLLGFVPKKGSNYDTRAWINLDETRKLRDQLNILVGLFDDEPAAESVVAPVNVHCHVYVNGVDVTPAK